MKLLTEDLSCIVYFHTAGDVVVAQGVGVGVAEVKVEVEAVVAGVEVAGVEEAEVVEERMQLISQLRNLTWNWRPIMPRPCTSRDLGISKSSILYL